MDDLDPAALLTDHQACHGCSETEEHCLGCAGLAPWPCLPYRLAEALAISEAKVARVTALVSEMRATKVSWVLAAADEIEDALEHQPA